MQCNHTHTHHPIAIAFDRVRVLVNMHLAICIDSHHIWELERENGKTRVRTWCVRLRSLMCVWIHSFQYAHSRARKTDNGNQTSNETGHKERPNACWLDFRCVGFSEAFFIHALLHIKLKKNIRKQTHYTHTHSSKSRWWPSAGAVHLKRFMLRYIFTNISRGASRTMTNQKPNQNERLKRFKQKPPHTHSLLINIYTCTLMCDRV